LVDVENVVVVGTGLAGVTEVSAMPLRFAALVCDVEDPLGEGVKGVVVEE
jgi:hypothetical protein